MSLTLAVVLLLLLFVVGGAYYERSRLRGTWIGSGLAVILIILVVVWFAVSHAPFF